MVGPERLGRFSEQGVTERAALDALLDSQWAGVLSTVVEGKPLAVPMLYARVGDAVILHGSTGAGALRHVAAGSPAVLTVFALDALVVAPTTFESSVNYRSATIRGSLQVSRQKTATLDLFSERLLPGRTSEVRASSAKELAASLAMTLAIEPDNWLLKVADDWPTTPEESDASPDVWSGLVPLRTVLEPAVPAPWAEHLAIPESVRRLTEPPTSS
ncbi:Fmn flavoprotein [metagenome]|uniref:Fmn flavoprotein n=1 Tax=metagenome TaxID=256318 RepID=A0A2P2CCR3_9ZZZZ